ncbi:MAG: cyclic nucleotide-binding domain-containing protein [Oscillospiraceae bacterium]|nr:cyclic nucleotide-binding domain-containing protein [Oscillospiraceae bacterium]
MQSGNEMIKGLKTFPLLSRLSDEELASLAAVMQEKRFPAGTEILREGEEGDELFLLLEGSVDVLKTTPYGEPYVTASLRDSYHCSFGEMALIDRGKRSATVRARTACRTLSLGYEAFQSFCRENPTIGLELLFSISATLVRDLRMENENLHIVYQALIEEIENN